MSDDAIRVFSCLGRQTKNTTCVIPIAVTSYAVTATMHKLIGGPFPVCQVCPSHRTGGKNAAILSAAVLFLITTEHQRWESCVLPSVSVRTRALDTNQGVKLDRKKCQEKFGRAAVEESGRPGCNAGDEMAGGDTIRPKRG